MMDTGHVDATRRLQDRIGLTISGLGVIDLSEALCLRASGARVAPR